MIQRASEATKFTQYRPEQIRLLNILRDVGLSVRCEFEYEVTDDLNERPQGYIADLVVLSKPILLIEIQGSSHDSEKGMKKTERKRELSEKAGYKYLEISDGEAKEYPAITLIEMVLKELKKGEQTTN